MRSNSKHTVEELEQYILLYLEEEKSYQELWKEYGLTLSDATFYQKVLRYQAHGVQGIQTKRWNNHYSQDFKEKVVQEYLEKATSIQQLARHYNIPSHETVRNWINKYTKGEEIRGYAPKPEVYTMKGRKTTQEEKITIVQDCLANGLSYKETAEKYQVSYNNVYSWVQKYQQHGPEGLVDGTGRGKPATIQTEEERMRTEYAALKARNEYLETENAALKKLKEVERELMLQKRAMKRNTKRFKSSKKKDSREASYVKCWG